MYFPPSGLRPLFVTDYPQRKPSADLASQANELLTGLRAVSLKPFLRDWPNQPAARKVEPLALSVLRWLSRIQELAPPFSVRFVDAIAGAAPALAWQRSHTIADVGPEFLDNYGWTEFVGLSGPTPSDRLACGVLLLGPDSTYPPHRHEAEEVYVPLAGTAMWKQGSGGWQEQPPGAVIHHARYEPHAMRTKNSPLLALYLWRSTNLAQKSQLDPMPGFA